MCNAHSKRCKQSTSDSHSAQVRLGPRVPLTTVTARPIGAKRVASLTTSYHLTFPTPDQASRAHTLINQRPLFAASSTRANARGDADRNPRVAYTRSPAEEWAERALARAAREGERPQVAGEQVLDHIGAKWALDKSARNRRVLVTGLPLRAAERDVRKLATGVADISEVKCRMVPHAPWSSTSAWAVTATSVAQAHQLARKLNQNYFAEERWKDRWLMRAHVHP